MAFVLAGLAATGLAGGIYYLYDETSKAINYAVQPFTDYINKEQNDSNERSIEDLRQKQHDQLKQRNERNDGYRKKYNLKERKRALFHNNSEVQCQLIYINHHLAKNEKEAKSWAKKIINVDYFSGDYLNRSNTKTIILNIDQKIEIIEDEFRDYYIILFCLEQYHLITKDILNVNDILFGYIKDDSLDLGCRSWLH